MFHTLRRPTKGTNPLLSPHLQSLQARVIRKNKKTATSIRRLNLSWEEDFRLHLERLSSVDKVKQYINQCGIKSLARRLGVSEESAKRIECAVTR
jgi:hypothetical protein